MILYLYNIYSFAGAQNNARWHSNSTDQFTTMLAEGQFEQNIR